MLEGLGDAEAILAGPDEARNVVRVYGLRRQDVAGEVGDALLVFSSQRPELASGEGPVAVGFSLSPYDALAENVAVGLVVVGGDAGAQPVSLIVAAQGAPTGFAFGHEGDAGLAGAAVELAEPVGIGAFVRNTAEGSGNIAAGGLGAINSFTRGEATGREGDALVVKGSGTCDFLLDLGGLVGDGSGEGNLIAFEVGNGGLQRGDGGCVVPDGLLLRGSGGLSLVRGSLRIGGGLLGLLQLCILVGEVGLERVNLALQFLAQGLNLFFDRGRRWRFGPGGLPGCCVFLSRRRCIVAGVRG